MVSNLLCPTEIGVNQLDHSNSDQMSGQSQVSMQKSIKSSPECLTLSLQEDRSSLESSKLDNDWFPTEPRASRFGFVRSRTPVSSKVSRTEVILRAISDGRMSPFPWSPD